MWRFKADTEFVRAAELQPGDRVRFDRRWFVALFVEQASPDVRITCVNGHVVNFPSETLLLRKAIAKA